MHVQLARWACLLSACTVCLLHADREAHLPAAALRLHTSRLHMLPTAANSAPAVCAGTLQKPNPRTALRCVAGLAAREQALHSQSSDECLFPHQVLEETGYDVSPLLVEEDFIEIHLKEQRNKLYIIQGVSAPTACHLLPARI